MVARTLRRSILLLSCLALLATGLPACSGSQSKDDESAKQEQTLPPYFAEIPADSLFVVAGTEPIPQEMVASVLSYLEAGYTALQEFQQEMTAQMGTGAEPPTDVASALLDELGDFDPESLEKTGIASEPHIAAYLVGNVPVLRIELVDKTAFAATLGRIETKLDLDPMVETFGEDSFRRYELERPPTSAPSDEREPGPPLLVRITDSEVIIAAPGKTVMKTFVPYFLGQRTPKKSLADANQLAAVQKKHGLMGFGVGYLDLVGMTRVMVGGELGDGIGADVLRDSEFEPAQFSSVCQDEIVAMVEKAPRMVMGFRDYNENVFDYTVGVELDEQLVGELDQVRSGIVGWKSETAQQSLVSLGLGFHIGRTLDFAGQQARKIRKDPYQCEELVEWNNMAAQFAGVTGQVPPSVRKIAGLSLLFKGLAIDNDALVAALESAADDAKADEPADQPDAAPGEGDSTPDAPKEGEATPQDDATADADEVEPSPLVVEALALLHTPEPEALLFMMSTFAPQLQSQELQRGEEPARLKWVEQKSEMLSDVFLTLTDRGLGASFGPGMKGKATSLLAAETERTPLFAMRFNFGAPLRALVADARSALDAAETTVDARDDITAEDVKKARAAISEMEEKFDKIDADAYAQMDFDLTEAGVFASYRAEGQSSVDLDYSDEFEANFDALWKVLTPAKNDEPAREADTL